MITIRGVFLLFLLIKWNTTTTLHNENRRHSTASWTAPLCVPRVNEHSEMYHQQLLSLTHIHGGPERKTSETITSYKTKTVKI